MGIASALFLLLLFYAPQEKIKWQRLYTYEGSAVEVDASNISFSNEFTGRVRFRLVFSRPQPLTGKQVNYSSVIETIGFRCEQRRYRVVDVKRYDKKENLVDSDDPKSSGEWKQEWEEVRRGSMMDRFLQPGCHVIYEKRRDPRGHSVHSKQL